LYKLCLAAGGHVVEEATDGREALAKTYSLHPRLLIADVQIPFIDGLELCRLIRSDPSMATTRVVLVTSNSLAEAQHRIRTVGADAVLVKPVQPDQLLTEIARLIEPHEPSDSAASRPAARREGGAALPSVTRSPIKARRREQFVTRQPASTPPELRCPSCDRLLQYDRSHIGGVGTYTAEQWDYFVCAQCGTFQYRHRTRKLRRVS
jgi:CheY-like chemotaxis protein